MADDANIEERSIGEVAEAERTRSGRVYRPNVDILAGEDELTLLADVPGVKSEDMDIHFEGGMLTLHGQVKEREPEGATRLLHEYGIGDFHRTFQVSEVIDASRITAELRNGVLTLHLPKVEAARPRKIAVEQK